MPILPTRSLKVPIFIKDDIIFQIFRSFKIKHHKKNIMNMKHFYLAFLILIFIFGSCKDENDKMKELIEGEWEITETTIDNDDISQKYQRCLSPYRFNFSVDSVIFRDGMIYDTETQNYSDRNKYYKFSFKNDSLFLTYENEGREYKITKLNNDTLILQRDIFIDILTRVKCNDVKKIDKLNIKYTRLNQNNYSSDYSFLIEINDNKEVYKTMYFDNISSNHYKGKLLDSYYDYFKDITRFTRLSEIEDMHQESLYEGIHHKISIQYEGFENTLFIDGKPKDPGIRALLDELNEIVNNIEYIEISPEEIVEWQKNAPTYESDFKRSEKKSNGS